MLKRSCKKIYASVFDYNGIEFVDYHDKYKILGNQTYNSLCERVQMHPNSIIIVDDIDQMHSSCLNIMRQIFKEGRISTPSGETVDFSSCIFFMTTKSSNSSAEMGFHSSKNQSTPLVPASLSGCSFEKIFLKKMSKKDLVRVFARRIRSISDSLNDPSVMKNYCPWDIRKFINNNCQNEDEILEDFDEVFEKQVVEALYN
jgi:ATP-dependent Clp protease ATP-binding subunit ClpA